MAYTPTGTPLDPATRRQINDHVATMGPDALARKMGLAKATLAQAAAGWPVRADTAAGIRDGLRDLADPRTIDERIRDRARALIREGVHISAAYMQALQEHGIR